jgi:hypothetical protein
MTPKQSTIGQARRTAVAAVAAGTLASALLAGCSHGGSGHTASAATGSGLKAVAGVPKADNIANDPKARPSVSMKDCAATGSGWSAGGTVTNSTAATETFTIVVSYTTKQSTVLARGETKVTLKAGQTRNWTTSANFAKTKAVVCVLRGVSES